MKKYIPYFSAYNARVIWFFTQNGNHCALYANARYT